MTRDARGRTLEAMRLTRKFIAALVIGVAIVALIQGLTDYRPRRDVFDHQMTIRGRSARASARARMADVWTRDGEAAARQFFVEAHKTETEACSRAGCGSTRPTGRAECDSDELAPLARGERRRDQEPDRRSAAHVRPGRRADRASARSRSSNRSTRWTSYTRDSLRNQMSARSARSRSPRRSRCSSASRSSAGRCRGSRRRRAASARGDFSGPLAARAARRARRARERDERDVRAARRGARARRAGRRRASRCSSSCATPTGS